MKVAIFLIIFLFNFFCCHAQELTGKAAFNQLKLFTWTDGYEFVTLADEDFTKSTLGQDVDTEHIIMLFGGTFHEGGSYLTVALDGENLVLRDNSFFTIGDIITIDLGKKLMFVRSANGDALHGIMKAVDKPDDVRNLLETNILRLVLAGRYFDDQGRMFEFADSNFVLNILPNKSQHKNQQKNQQKTQEKNQHKTQRFKLAAPLDIPSQIICFGALNYAFDKTPAGLTFMPLSYSHNNGDFIVDNNAKALYLKRMVSNSEFNFPLLSCRYFTLPELLLYAGSAFSQTRQYSTQTMKNNLLETLSLMRNELYARHGYKFKSKKWQDIFADKLWYKPIKTNEDSNLSDIEKCNIQLILSLERRFRE